MRSTAFVRHEQIGFSALGREELDGNAAHVRLRVCKGTGLPVRKAARHAVEERRIRIAAFREGTRRKRGRHRGEDAQRAERAHHLLLVLTPVDTPAQARPAARRDRFLLCPDLFDHGGQDVRRVQVVFPSGAGAHLLPCCTDFRFVRHGPLRSGSLHYASGDRSLWQPADLPSHASPRRPSVLTANRETASDRMQPPGLKQVSTLPAARR